MASPQAGLIAGHIRPTDCVVRLQDGLKWRLTRPGPHGLARSWRSSQTAVSPARGSPGPADRPPGSWWEEGASAAPRAGRSPARLLAGQCSIVRSRCTISKHILAEITPGLGGPPLRAWSIGGLHEAAALASRQVPDFWSPDGQPTQAVVSEAGRGRNPAGLVPRCRNEPHADLSPLVASAGSPAGATSSAPSEARRSGLQSGSTRVRRCAGRVFT